MTQDEDNGVDAAADGPERWLRTLAEQGSSEQRFERGRRLGEGGMGVVDEAFDRFLRRTVALKCLSARRLESTRALARFLDEARITAQLDHPGIVPLYDVGVFADGQPWYTMKLVKGRTLADVFQAGEWSLPRLVEALLRVCEAMAYAHQKGVIHRDLKPANVMVGRYGEVLVMDLGLARLIGDGHPGEGGLDPSALTDALGDSLRVEGTPATQAGVFVGTPVYAAPEQLAGDREAVGPATDVYAVGAMVYEVLAGARPYATAHEPQGLLAERLARGELVPLSQAAPGAPPELVAVCERAMARQPSERFADMESFAAQLRSWLEGRVVTAYRTGPWIELVKWCRRNRLTAAAVLLVVLGAAVSGWLIARSEHRARLAGEAQMARESEGLLIERAESVVQRAQTLGSGTPDGLARMEEWLASASRVLDESAGVEAELEALRARGRVQHDWRPVDSLETQRLRAQARNIRTKLTELEEPLAEGAPPLRAEQRRRQAEVLPQQLAWITARLEQADAVQEWARPVEYDSVTDRQRAARLVRLAAARQALTGASGLRRRIEREVAAVAEQGREGESAWELARAAIADREQHPLYGGLVAPVQAGLVPLGPNPVTGLWEFWHVPSGGRPARMADGSWELTRDSGLVLVLIPGGRTHVGVQAGSAGRPGYDFLAQAQDGPPVEALLQPYFVAAHELTQAQWARLTGTWPAQGMVGHYFEDFGLTELPIDEVHPVESVSWAQAAVALERWGLVLPTEAQWSHAARGGLDEPYAAAFSLEEMFADPTIFARRMNSGWERNADNRARSGDAWDGALAHARVGSYPPNRFGLFDMLGNVGEWCRDWYAADFRAGQVLGVAPGSGELLVDEPHQKTWRGGSYEFDPVQDARIGARHGLSPYARDASVGVRPARPLRQDPR